MDNSSYDEEREAKYLSMDSRFSSLDQPLLRSEELEEEKTRPWPGIAAAIIYVIVGTGLPLYNKYVLGSPQATGGFKFPLTVTWLQLAACSVLVVLVLLARNVFPKFRGGSLQTLKDMQDRRTFLLIIPAALFAANIALTNVGLFMINVTAHLLLRNSEIVWVVLLAFFWKSERPNIWAVLSCAIITAGVVLVSLFVTTEQPSSAMVGPMLINLASALASALQYMSLRLSVTHLRERQPNLSFIEVSAVKISLAALFVLVPTLVFELDGFRQLSLAPPLIAGLVVGGIGITLVFQGTVVALAFFSKATTTAVVSQVKIVPQVILAIVVFGTYHTGALVTAGTVLVCVGCAAYGVQLAVLLWRQRRRTDGRHTPPLSINTDA